MTIIPVDPGSIRVLDGSTVWADVTHPGWEKGSEFKVREQYTRWHGKWQLNGGGDKRLDDPPELGTKEYVWGSKRKVSPHGPYTIWDYGGPQIEYHTYESSDGTTRWAAVAVPPPKRAVPELVIDMKWLQLQWGWGDCNVQCRCCGEMVGYRRLLTDYLMDGDERVMVRGCPLCHIRDCCDIVLGEPDDVMVRAAVMEDFRNGRSDGVRS